MLDVRGKNEEVFPATNAVAENERILGSQVYVDGTAKNTGFENRDKNFRLKFAIFDHLPWSTLLF